MPVQNNDGVIRRICTGLDGLGAVRMATIDKEKHTAEFIIATDTPIKDSPWNPPVSLSMKGANFKEYRKNPVVLYRHENDPLAVIANTQDIFVEKNLLIARALFDVDDELGLRLWGKIERGFVRATSVGYKTMRTREVAEGIKDEATGYTGPFTLATQWIVKEWSIVGVGADPQSLGREAGADGNESAPDGKKIFTLKLLPVKLP